MGTPEGADVDSVISELESTAESALVDVDQPSYTDLFNYFTYVRSDD